MINPSEMLSQCKAIYEKIWKDQDIKAMALECIDSICVAVEDGADKDWALDLIYRFAHCSQDCICYDSHEDWREELKAYFKKENIDPERKLNE